MSTGNKAIPDLPAIPDPTGGSLYITKDSTDYRVDTGGAGGLATLGADGLLDPSQRFILSSLPWTSITSKPTTISGFGITDAVTTTGDQAIVGTKSFINTISGNISGNAATATSATTAGSASAVPWTGVSGKPTTLAGYGITDAVLTSASNLDATKLTGTIADLRLNGSYSNVNTFTVINVATAGQFKSAASGSAPSPMYTSATDTNTGMYFPGADQVGFTTGGVLKGTFSSTGLAVVGAITATGNITGYSSDARLKTNVKNIEDPMGKLYKIGGYTFDWDSKKCFIAGFHPDNPTEHGVLAQEVMKVVPDAVSRAAFHPEYLTVNYPRLIPLLIECIKDLQAQIDELKKD